MVLSSLTKRLCTSHCRQSKRAGSPNKKGQLYLMAAALRNHLSNKKKECTQTLRTTLLRNTVWGAVPAAGWALSGGSLRQEAWTGADPLHNQRMATWSYRSWWLSCNTSDLDCEGTKAQGLFCSGYLYGGTSSSCYSVAAPWENHFSKSKLSLRPCYEKPRVEPTRKPRLTVSVGCAGSQARSCWVTGAACCEGSSSESVGASLPECSWMVRQGNFPNSAL